MEYRSELIPRILRDLDDVAIGRTYAEIFFDEQKKEK